MTTDSQEMTMRILILMLFVATLAVAQTPAPTPASEIPKSPWTHSLVSGLTATQISFRDWSQGGENAFSWTASLDGKHVFDTDVYSWGNAYKLAYGQAQIGSQGTRKTDDKIDLESILTYKMGSVINPYFAATLKTQFAKGYTYAATGNTEVSDIFDPAYFTQSVGVGYQPIPEVKTRFGAALREIVTSKHVQYADDPKTAAIEKTKTEGGMESVTNVDWKIEENVLLSSKLELFAAFKTLDKVIVRNDNTLAAKVGKFLSVNLNIQLVNDAFVSTRTQVKQTISFGFSYVLI